MSDEDLQCEIKPLPCLIKLYYIECIARLLHSFE